VGSMDDEARKQLPLDIQKMFEKEPTIGRFSCCRVGSISPNTGFQCYPIHVTPQKVTRMELLPTGKLKISLGAFEKAFSVGEADVFFKLFLEHTHRSRLSEMTKDSFEIDLAGLSVWEPKSQLTLDLFPPQLLIEPLSTPLVKPTSSSFHLVGYLVLGYLCGWLGTHMSKMIF